MSELRLGFLLFILDIEMWFDRIRDILRPIVNISVGQMDLQTAAAFGIAFILKTGRTLLQQGELFVTIPDVLTAEQLRNHVERVLTGEMTRDELRERGKERLKRAVEYGPSDVQRIR